MRISRTAFSCLLRLKDYGPILLERLSALVEPLGSALSHLARRGSIATSYRLPKPLNLLNSSGREGMTSLPIVLGDHRSPHATYIQAPGMGKCIAAAELRQATESRRTLRDFVVVSEALFLERQARFLKRQLSLPVSTMSQW
jgi:hypothetical protein